MTLETWVGADPVACRAVGQWLRGTADRVHDAGSVLQRVRGDSESVWVGEAGEAFREHVGGGRRDADDLSWAVRRSGEALLGFADEIDTVRARMDQARSVAADAGLTVTATGVEPPGPAPTVSAAVPGAAPLTEEIGSLARPAAFAAHERKMAAWAEVQTTVAEARGFERDAHQMLVRRIRDEQSLWDSIKNGSRFTAVNALLGGPAELYNAGNKWSLAAAGHRADAAGARAVLDTAHSTPAQRAQAMRDFVRSAGRERAATRAATSNARTLGPLGRSPSAGRLLGRVGASVKGVPVLGVGLTGIQVAEDIRAGKPADRAVASGSASLVAGVGASAAFTTAAVAVGVAGGPVTLGAVAIGIGASALAGWAVDRYWDDIQDSAVGQAIGNSSVGRTFDAIF